MENETACMNNLDIAERSLINIEMVKLAKEQNDWWIRRNELSYRKNI